jgi:AcrR family transcriptional regulator
MRISAEAKAATRQRILDETRALLAVKGYEATTTRDIAHAAEIAIGTLFNYFPTKEEIVSCLVSEAFVAPPSKAIRAIEATSLEEELFAAMANGLRALKPYRKHLPALLETTLSPLATTTSGRDTDALRVSLLEAAHQAAGRYGLSGAMSPVALQLYWTLYTGVLVFWANDRSPKQEDTLALLDQSTAMFVTWLRTQSSTTSSNHED